MSRRSTPSGGGKGVGPGTLGRPDEFKVERVYREQGIPMVQATIGNRDVQMFDPDDLPGFSSEEPLSTQKRRDRRMQANLSDFR